MGTSSRKKRGPRPTRERAPKRSALEAQEATELINAIELGAPPPGSNLLAVEPVPPQYGGAKHFDVLPLSQHTKRGLAEHKFTHLTAIQRAAVPHALCGRDLLGAAKTGSGKTLAFLIPVRRISLVPYVCLQLL